MDLNARTKVLLIRPDKQRAGRSFLSGEPALCGGQLEHSKQALENRGINLAVQTIFHVMMATYPFMSCLSQRAAVFRRPLFAARTTVILKKSPRCIKQLHKV